ncbi:NAD(P)/FAD-dependent oxidoreductase [Paraliobacillus ryukyuensis]|uniref:NAD(P)/FAD-dependent oxidoreductase n=1 Tax=Paraliobacillus ryukyuensis TaxID=200904 RepID=UPI0009A817F0|nr:FAD-dependent oxidoreductase [Paraliobacillus ryukyuensis]
MNIQSGTYYWPTTMPDAPTYPTLTEDIACDVLIVGGGSSGAQCAYYLASSGLHVALIEKNNIGNGSTSANTALIQYAGDKMFINLRNTFGSSYISKHLKQCRRAINDIELAAKQIEFDCSFTRRDSLYFASYPEDIGRLQQEYQLLKEEQFPLQFLTRKDIEELYPFSKAAAIYFEDDAELNPYIFTHGLIKYAMDKGVQVFEHTKLNGHVYHEDGVEIHTDTDHVIQAKQVIYCAGYENMEFKKEKQATFVSTYTVTTEPVADLSSWPNQTLIWETARPYLYIRTTADNRVIIGGLDDNTIYPEDRDSKLIAKRDQLITGFHKLFPTIPVKPAYYLTGQYGGMRDGLPIIGRYPDAPHSYFLNAYGDNGTVYSQLLSRIIVEDILQGPSQDLSYYVQDRPLLKS